MLSGQDSDDHRVANAIVAIRGSGRMEAIRPRDARVQRFEEESADIEVVVEVVVEGGKGGLARPGARSPSRSVRIPRAMRKSVGILAELSRLVTRTNEIRRPRRAAPPTARRRN